MNTLVNDYHKHLFEMYKSLHPDADEDKVMALLQNFTDQNMKDIPCVMDNNVTHERHDTTISQVCDWITNRTPSTPIITGNGTFFKQHEEYLSPSVIMLETVQENRGELKDEMYTFESGTVEYENAYTTQNSIKTIMNADYGGSGTKFAPFYSKYIPAATTLSARNVTTTLICCLEFSSNPDDKYSKCNNIDELFDMIYCVLNDEEDRDLIQDDYSVEDVLKRLISLTNDLTLKDINMLKRYLLSLQPYQRTKLMLAFNVTHVLERYLENELSNVMGYYKSNPIQLKDITGKKDRMEIEKELLDVAGFGASAPDVIIDNINHITKTVIDNCVYPFMLNDNEIRSEQMKRKIVCVTDTDSLMVHFSHYIDTFQARVDSFRDSCLFASALGFRLFIEGIIPKFVTYIADACNIKDEKYRNKFKFKNEYCYLAMGLIAKKMYAASMFAQEGRARDQHKLQITGLSFKKRDAAEFLESIMVELYDKYILTPDEIQVDKILDVYYELREKLMNELNFDPSYFKVLSIKDESSYNTDKILPGQILGTKVWNAIMEDEKIHPMDRVIFVQLSWDKIDANMHIPKVAEVCKWAEQLSLDSVEAASMRNIQNGKPPKKIRDPQRAINPYICLPEHYKTFPDWVSCIINTEETCDKLLTPFKQLLGLFDVYLAQTKGGMIASRMIMI